MGVKLNIGCWKHIFPGWINLDIRPQRDDVILYDFLTDKLPAEPGTVDQIFYGYVWMYIDKDMYQERMQECADLLRPGGRLVIKEDDNRRKVWRQIGRKVPTGTIRSNTNQVEMRAVMESAGLSVIDGFLWEDIEILDSHNDTMYNSFVLTGIKPFTIGDHPNARLPKKAVS